MGEERRDCAGCPGMQKAGMLEKQLDQWQRQTRDDRERFDRRLIALERAEAARCVQYESILEKLDRLIAWQEEQQGRPARRWEAVAERSLLMTVAAVIAFVLGRVGL